MRLEIKDEEHPEGDIAIEIVGLRPGEKLYEELLIGDNVEGTSHPLIMRAFEYELPWEFLVERLEQFDQASRAFDYARVLSLLEDMVQEYAPARHGDGELIWKQMEQTAVGGVG